MKRQLSRQLNNVAPRITELGWPCVPVYASCPDIVDSTTTFHSQKCPSLNHTFYGYLQECARAGKVLRHARFPSILSHTNGTGIQGRPAHDYSSGLNVPVQPFPFLPTGEEGRSCPHILCARPLLMPPPPSRTLLSVGLRLISIIKAGPHHAPHLPTDKATTIVLGWQRPSSLEKEPYCLGGLLPEIRKRLAEASALSKTHGPIYHSGCPLFL